MCTGDTIDTCGRRFTTYAANKTAVFEELNIEADMPTPIRDSQLSADGFVVYPVALNVSIMPLEVKDFIYSKTTTNERTVHNYRLNNFDVELYTFGIWGRFFAPDGEEVTPPVAGSANVNLLSIILFIPLLARSLIMCI